MHIHASTCLIVDKTKGINININPLGVFGICAIEPKVIMLLLFSGFLTPQGSANLAVDGTSAFWLQL